MSEIPEDKLKFQLKARAELARLAYGEQILQCTNRDPEEMTGFLMLDGEIEKARLWRAFAIAKREGSSDYIRGMVAYMISHEVGECNRQKQKNLIECIERSEVHLKDLTFEQLAGTHLRWRHIFQLLGKEFNPTREKEFVKQVYERLKKEEELHPNHESYTRK
ncbi:MAG: hypothetical protein A2Z21_07170 [Candidatus Fraserbacteria bacterium RBG_16_55_9]|uniref:Uncharacterized protein n=1 Tax=Fraserbacteria sp. (strain RBG_16_55_9) TaxID=1817864 RepID=A0A1F5USL8_FRAXR|nr:MAG: hypothetical protein A2Z21_07170 [Candidatus Fraserbacteria bacterium RBG_16_55_9]